MSSEQRKHVRFSLDIPMVRYTPAGEAVGTLITQIGLGGCVVEWSENIYIGDEFRMLVRLPNLNFLPLTCKAIYKLADPGVGVKFLYLSLFEQELLAKIITQTLEKQGLPVLIDPFAPPKKVFVSDAPPSSDVRREQDEMLENLL